MGMKYCVNGFRISPPKKKVLLCTDYDSKERNDQVTPEKDLMDGSHTASVDSSGLKTPTMKRLTGSLIINR